MQANKLYPRGLNPAGHGITVFSRKMRTTVPGCTSYGDTTIRCPASHCISDLVF